MELLNVLNDLEELVEEATKIPMTNKVVIDADDLLDYVDRIRSVLPEEIKQAKWIVNEHQKIIDDAEIEAKRIVEEGQNQVSKIAEETEVVKQAQAHAEDIINQAKQVANEIRNGANEYADDLLESLQKTLEKTLGEVARGRDELSSTKKK
ncbi:MAG: ATPase [Clostridia bacterium]|nr:ATPase [Clostridia bacterium]